MFPYRFVQYRIVSVTFFCIFTIVGGVNAQDAPTHLILSNDVPFYAEVFLEEGVEYENNIPEAITVSEFDPTGKGNEDNPDIASVAGIATNDRAAEISWGDVTVSGSAGSEWYELIGFAYLTNSKTVFDEKNGLVLDIPAFTGSIHHTGTISVTSEWGAAYGAFFRNVVTDGSAASSWADINLGKDADSDKENTIKFGDLIVTSNDSTYDDIPMPIGSEPIAGGAAGFVAGTIRKGTVTINSIVADSTTWALGVQLDGIGEDGVLEVGTIEANGVSEVLGISILGNVAGTMSVGTINVTADNEGKLEQANAFGVRAGGIEKLILNGNVNVSGSGNETSGIRTYDDTTITLGTDVTFTTEHTGNSSDFTGANIWTDGNLRVDFGEYTLQIDTIKVDGGKDLILSGYGGTAELGSVIMNGDTGTLYLGLSEGSELFADSVKGNDGKINNFSVYSGSGSNTLTIGEDIDVNENVRFAVGEDAALTINNSVYAASMMVTGGGIATITGDAVIVGDGTITGITTLNDGTLVVDGDFTTGGLKFEGGNIRLSLANEGTVSVGKLDLNNAKFDVDFSNTTLTMGANEFNVIEVTTGYTAISPFQLDNQVKLLNRAQQQTALVRYEWAANENSLDLNVNVLTVKQFADEIGWKQKNASTVALLFDKAAGTRPELIENQQLFAGFTDSVSDIEKRLEIEGLSGAELQNALRTAMAGELVGNAARMVTVNSPHRTVFKRLDTQPSSKRPIARGQAGGKMRLWFNPYAQSEEGDGDQNTFDGYSLTRVGFMLGGDVNITQRMSGGVFFNYGSPQIKSNLGKINADDFMVGVYARIPLWEHFYTNAMIGYGIQDYTYKGNGNNSSFDGNTLFGSLDVSRNFALKNVRFKPFLGLDFQSTAMDELAVTVPKMGRMSIAPDGLDSVMVRVGLRSECLRVRAHVQYMRQVAGDDYMVSTMMLGGEPASVRSAQWGKDWVNLGFGYDFFSTRNFKCSIDYDLDVSKNVSSHLGSVSASITW